MGLEGVAARDINDIDSELRILAVVRLAARAKSGRPSTRLVDELLDERSAVVERR